MQKLVPATLAETAHATVAPACRTRCTSTSTEGSMLFEGSRLPDLRDQVPSISTARGGNMGELELGPEELRHASVVCAASVSDPAVA